MSMEINKRTPPIRGILEINKRTPKFLDSHFLLTNKRPPNGSVKELSHSVDERSANFYTN